MLPDAWDGRGVVGRCWEVVEGWVEEPRIREKRPIALKIGQYERSTGRCRGIDGDGVDGNFMQENA
jgi:hypothetical protein